MCIAYIFPSEKEEEEKEQTKASKRNEIVKPE